MCQHFALNCNVPAAVAFSFAGLSMGALPPFGTGELRVFVDGEPVWRRAPVGEAPNEVGARPQRNAEVIQEPF